MIWFLVLICQTLKMWSEGSDLPLFDIFPYLGPPLRRCFRIMELCSRYSFNLNALVVFIHLDECIHLLRHGLLIENKFCRPMVDPHLLLVMFIKIFHCSSSIKNLWFFNAYFRKKFKLRSSSCTSILQSLWWLGTDLKNLGKMVYTGNCESGGGQRVSPCCGAFTLESIKFIKTSCWGCLGKKICSFSFLCISVAIWE